MDNALENAYSTLFKEIENSVSEVEKKLCKLSQEKFKTFLGDSTENRKGNFTLKNIYIHIHMSFECLFIDPYLYENK